MWKNVLTFLLVVYMLAGFIGSIIFTNSIGWNFWWVMPLGWILTFLSSATIGTLIDIAQKTEENNAMLIRLTANQSDESKKSQLSGRADSEKSSEQWRCSKCGDYNENNTSFCKSCGQYK